MIRKLYLRVQAAPLWAKPIIGLIIFPFIAAAVPIALPLFFGWMLFETFFEKIPPSPR